MPITRTSPVSAGLVTAGLPVAVASAVAFGLSGPIGRSLIDAGWSSAAVALARIGGAAALLLIPTIVVLVRSGRQARAWGPRLVAYGLVAIAGVQLCFFTAIQHAPISSVLLIEYLAPVLLIVWTWLRTRRAPSPMVLSGAAVAVAGLVFVIGAGADSTISATGAVWAFGAAICLTAYFAIAASESGPRPPALVLTGGGMALGTLAILAAAGTGVLSLQANTAPVELAGFEVSFLVPVLVLALVCALLAYLTGILAVRILGGRVASFFSLSEVLFALTAAWLLLGEQPTVQQGVGGAIVLAGVAVIGADGHAKDVLAGAWLRSRDVLVPAGRTLARRTGRSLAVGARGTRRVARAVTSPPARWPGSTGPGRRSSRPARAAAHQSDAELHRVARQRNQIHVRPPMTYNR